MLKLRAFLACGMIVVGSILVVRVLATGISFAVVPGLVLGAAIVLLGLYRLKQLREATQAR